MTTQLIHWTNLAASSRNVRKIKTGIETLAASIAADGLLHNLTVTAREDGKYEVIAGERRRRAIIQLVRAGTWPRNTHIPCEVRDENDATAISYAENAQRVAMHPADAIRAFRTLASEGQNEAGIAHRYGYDPREVRRMLTLASLSPRVLNALAADKIDVAAAQAFTLTDDHRQQDKVLRSARTAHEVRRMLTQTKVTTGHRLFRFIGAEAYTEGGGMTRDLFAEGDEGYADDPALVQRLAEEKFEALRSEAEAAGWGETIAVEQTPYESYQWHRLYPDEGEGYSEEARAGAVLLITVTGDGTPTTTAYTRKAKRIAPTEASGGASVARSLYDAKTTEALSRILTTALQAEVAANVRVAHAVLLDALLPMLRDGYAPSHAVRLRLDSGIQQPTRTHDINELEMASPFDGVAALFANVPDEAEARFQWLLSLDDGSVARLLAACAGALLDATEGKFADRSRMASANRIARSVDLDMRQHWEGGAEFFDWLGKKALLAGLAEACGESAAENCAKMKRGDLAAACADRIPGRGWLPPALRTPEPESVNLNDGFDCNDEDAGYLEYSPANDDEEFAIAAE